MQATVKERPILFSGPMVQALLAGRKTQTRRVVKLDMGPDTHSPELHHDGLWRWKTGVVVYNAHEISCPYGKPGDRLWVRETFARRLDVDPAEETEKAQHYALYRADGTSLNEPHWHSYPVRWTPAIHMPRWASRIDLEITELRVERLHDISEADKIAEGGTPEKPFGTVWRAINTKPGVRWEDNPWVWVVSFRRLEKAGGQ